MMLKRKPTVQSMAVSPDDISSVDGDQHYSITTSSPAYCTHSHIIFASYLEHPTQSCRSLAPFYNSSTENLAFPSVAIDSSSKRYLAPSVLSPTDQFRRALVHNRFIGWEIAFLCGSLLLTLIPKDVFRAVEIVILAESLFWRTIAIHHNRNWIGASLETKTTLLQCSL